MRIPSPRYKKIIITTIQNLPKMKIKTIHFNSTSKILRIPMTPTTPLLILMSLLNKLYSLAIISL